MEEETQVATDYYRNQFAKKFAEMTGKTTHESVAVCIQEAENAKQALHSIAQEVDDITSMNITISTRAEEQN